MSALLEVYGLEKRFGSRLLMNIPHLQIEAAKAYALTGANGTGKSTLLRILSGLEGASIERIHFCGNQVRLPPYPKEMRDAVIYVHQHPVMFSTSIERNIGFGLKARGIAHKEIGRRVGEAMEWAGVAHLKDRDPTVLSGGEKQRVALARARILNPKLLLLDEPTSNLDGPAKEHVIELIPSLINAGSSVVIACHDRDLINLPGMERLKLRSGQLESEPA